MLYIEVMSFKVPVKEKDMATFSVHTIGTTEESVFMGKIYFPTKPEISSGSPTLRKCNPQRTHGILNKSANLWLSKLCRLHVISEECHDHIQHSTQSGRKERSIY